MIESRHASLLKQKLADRRAEVLASLGAGVPSWDLYNRMVGQLQGFDEAGKLSDDADYDINGGS